MESFDLYGLDIFVDENHRFGTDAFLLSDFAAPKKNNIVCDLCTGCGIIPLLFMKNPPKKIFAVDIEKTAIDLLTNSVSQNNISKIIPVCDDLKNLPNGIIELESVDLVTVNPPYFKEHSGLIRDERNQANARHELLCTISDVVSTAAKILKFGGYLKMCHVPSRLVDVVSEMRSKKIEPKTITFITNKEGEKPWLFLVSGKKGAKPGVVVETKITQQN